MATRLAAAVLVLGGLIVLAAGQSQRFCYAKIGQRRTAGGPDASCSGTSCATEVKAETVFRTERRCCAGYRAAGEGCVPVCGGGCPEGQACVAPHRCDCAAGLLRDAQGRCVPPAAGCEPGTCESRAGVTQGMLDGGEPGPLGTEDSMNKPTVGHSQPQAGRRLYDGLIMHDHTHSNGTSWEAAASVCADGGSCAGQLWSTGDSSWTAALLGQLMLVLS